LSIVVGTCGTPRAVHILDIDSLVSRGIMLAPPTHGIHFAIAVFTVWSVIIVPDIVVYGNITIATDTYSSSLFLFVFVFRCLVFCH
jgi:hypothetical protein